jgi:hypothetical protein
MFIVEEYVRKFAPLYIHLIPHYLLRERRYLE